MMNDYDATEVQRTMANLIRIGKISALDEASARVRVDAAGLTTDWLPWAVARAGSTRTWSAPRMGEQVIVLSPYGDPAQGVVLPSLYQDDYPAPAGSKDQETTIYPDGATVDHNSATHATSLTLNPGGTLTAAVGPSSVVMDASRILLSSNGSTLELSAAGIAINGTLLTHNGKNVGNTHTHGGVMAGPANTGVPN